MAMTDYDSAMAENLMMPPDMGGMMAFRRAVIGLCLCAVSLLLMVILLSFSPYDHTDDTAGLGAVKNILGRPGANISNMLMQIMGAGGYILAFMLGYAGLRRLFSKPLKRTKWQDWGRIALIIGVVLFGTITLSGFPIPKYWPMGTGLGGWFGDIFFLNFRGGLEALNVPLSGFIVTFCFFLASRDCGCGRIGLGGFPRTS